jgi:hypothetical protein
MYREGADGMTVPESIKDEVYRRCGGRCECIRQHVGRIDATHHGGRCITRFTRHGTWEARFRIALNRGGRIAASNCEALCMSCYKLEQTYGNQ